jgi:hypothetical protein
MEKCMNWENAAGALGSLGIASSVGGLVGGLVVSYLKSAWEGDNLALLQQQELKQENYLRIVLLMDAVLDPDFSKQRPVLAQEGCRHLKSRDDLRAELKCEWRNAFLYASNRVLARMKDFIDALEDPQEEDSQERNAEKSMKQVALAMREDLWGGGWRDWLSLKTFRNRKLVDESAK